jgi:hypothetical protein
MARSIPSIHLLASAQGNQKEVFAFMQEVSQAYAFWRVLWAPEHIIALRAFVLRNRISKGQFCLDKYQSVPLLTQCPSCADLQVNEGIISYTKPWRTWSRFWAATGCRRRIAGARERPAPLAGHAPAPATRDGSCPGRRRGIDSHLQ